MTTGSRPISIIPLSGWPLVQKGDDVVEILFQGLKDREESLLDGDILVITQKIISKAEGSVVDLNDVEPSTRALRLAEEIGKDPKLLDIILKESKRIVRKRRGVVITEHRRGWVCANSGVDYSNVPGDAVSLLPRDPDESAENIRHRIESNLGVEVAVVIIDSQGRPFRKGVVGVALGQAGISGLVSKAGEEDLHHYKLKGAESALTDQVASAALLVMGESSEGIPAAVVRGLDYRRSGVPATVFVRSEEEDLFR